jgi:hypothetical protein
MYNLLMYTVSDLEYLRVPIQVEHVEEVENAGVVDPEDAVVVLRGAVWVVIERSAQLARPVHRVQLRVVAAPAQVRPRVLQLQQLHALSPVTTHHNHHQKIKPRSKFHHWVEFPPNIVFGPDNEDIQRFGIK